MRAQRKGKENSNKSRHASAATANPHAGAIQQRGCARSAAVAIEATLQYLEVPRDEEDWRFVQSFQVGDAAATEFFNTYGFVCYRDVLTQAETAAEQGAIVLALLALGTTGAASALYGTEASCQACFNL